LGKYIFKILTSVPGHTWTARPWSHWANLRSWWSRTHPTKDPNLTSIIHWSCVNLASIFNQFYANLSSILRQSCINLSSIIRKSCVNLSSILRQS
jgi:hypothetical protein